MILSYFAEDPLRILYAIGGSGGLWFWIVSWRRRIRVYIASIQHEFRIVSEPNLQVDLRFEIENLGDAPTSIKPEVLLFGYDKNGNRCVETLTIHSTNRRLEPHTPTAFVATGKIGADYVFWLFKCYRVQLSRGRDRTLRFRTQPGKGSLPFWRYDFELTLFRRFGWLPFIK